MRLNPFRLALARLAKNEEGFTMIAVIGAVATISLLAVGAVWATTSDQKLVTRDLNQKLAYAAAQAGIADYTYHLNNDNGYWARCTAVPTPNALNLNMNGAPANTRPVPGSTDGSRYGIELLQASTSPGNAQCSSSNPTATMLESTGANIGTFRVRSTGYSGPAKASIVATFKQATFLDYVYFTQLETSDPVTYGYANPSSSLDRAYDECTKFRRDGRPRAGTTSPSAICDTIVFVDGDHINGPVHTKDDICDSPGDDPTFGRNAADVIEVSAPPTGYHSSSNSGNGCTGSAPKPSPGTFTTNAPVLTPPTTNTTLKTFAGPSYTYTGQTRITLSGTNMSINGGSFNAIPSSGVVYVQNGAGCTTSYSPFTVTYPSSSGCGNAVVHTSGSYSGQLTIAAENDVIIDDDIVRSGAGLLGLVANNFIRVKHPVCESTDLSCSNGTYTEQAGKGDCDKDNDHNQAVDGTGTRDDIRIDAALLAIDHSFIVDHYDCGDKLGDLTVNGAIAQKYRGAVGTVGNTGYIKDYNYDDRLRYQEPPHFFDPVQSAWHVQRETLDFP
jgi:Tfp pilus assembly protein PilX